MEDKPYFMYTTDDRIMPHEIVRGWTIKTAVRVVWHVAMVAADVV